MAVLKPLDGGNYYIWKYLPSVAASIFFIIVWACITGLLLWRMIKTKTWFVTAYIVGCVMQVAGYAFRAIAYDRTNSLMIYALQGVLILLPPALFAATIYMVLGRIIRQVHGDHLSIVRPQKLTKIFVTGDILSFLIQGSGSGLAAQATKNPNMGKISLAIVLLGIALQLVFFGLFSLTALLFHLRIRKQPTTRSYEVDQGWVKVLYMLYATSALIMIRSIFRLIEYATGLEGYLLSTEWPLYVFDTALMIVCSIVFFVIYPGNLAGINTQENIMLQNQTSDDAPSQKTQCELYTIPATEK